MSQRLRAHRSIVNSAIFHRTLPFLFSAGVEKVVTCWSPASPGGDRAAVGRGRQRGSMDRGELLERVLTYRRRLHFDSSEENDLRLQREDPETLMLFDNLLDEDSDADTLWDSDAASWHQHGDGSSDEGAGSDYSSDVHSDDIASESE